MASTYLLQGSYSTTPLTGNPSGFPSVCAPIEEVTQLVNMTPAEYTLDADAVVSVSLGGCSEVNVLIVKTLGGKVRLRLTSADGTTQAVPVDSFLSLITLTVPITAIDIMREAGVETIVQLFMGERG